MSAHRPAAAMLAVACGFLLAPAAGEARQSQSPMVDQINGVREAHGVPPVHYSRSLAGSSSSFGRYLVRTHQFTHARRIMASHRFAKLGEILALTFGWDVRRNETLGDWMHSPRHRAVLLSPAFRYVGAARVRGDFDGSRALFWTVQFGR